MYNIVYEMTKTKANDIMKCRKRFLFTFPAALTSSAEYTAFEQRGQIFPDIDIILNAAPLLKLADGRRWMIETVCLVVTPPIYVTLFI
jgi:hypothetical protein